MARILAFAKRHYILTPLCLLALLLLLFIAHRAKGPYRFYRADLLVPAPGKTVEAGVLEAGVAKRDITPDLTKYDTWTDVDQDGRYNPDKGDTYQDLNGNGRFDAVWLAGFNSNRPAKGVHDPLWARAIAFRNNGVTVVMVTLDSIGIFHEKFIDIRKSIDPALGIDHVMFSCLHDHEAPDTMGIWSYSIVRPLFDHGYMDLVKKACREAVEEAVANLEPCEAILAEVPVGPDGFMDDSRRPLIYDNVIRAARFVKPGSDETIATLVVWGNHPETLGGRNSYITSDFPHYWREGVENGVPEPNGREGLGGMCLYFQGQVGGLMTQLHTTVTHRNGIDAFHDASFGKAESLGYNLAIETVKAFRADSARRAEKTSVAAAAKTIFVPVSGLYAYVALLGLAHPGWYWGKVRTEINVIRIGDIEILTVPGELYPEIGEGGIETPEGADFPGPIVESPPLRPAMNGKLNLIIGLANDEIGYIIPKTQWDKKPPYAYGRTGEPQYGEENSFGPDAAGTIHREALALLGNAN